MAKLPSKRKQEKALNIMENEISRWFNGEVTITDNISFTMRERIKQSRKNYWGIFTNPYDANGREKKWYPLSQWFCDLFSRQSDIDTKDVNTKAKRSGNVGIAYIVKYLIRHYMDKYNFAHMINDLKIRTIIDGTGVNRTIDGYGKKALISENIDLLNFITDPRAENVHESVANIEVSEIDIEEFMNHTEWQNKEELLKLIPKDTKEVPKVRVYFRVGKLPKYLLLDGKSDTGEWVETMLVSAELKTDSNFSDITNTSDYLEEQRGNKKIVLMLKKSPYKRRPYEETWFIKVPGRWYGLGIPEILFDLQELANENFNIRFNNARVLKNGLFKIRKGSGITPQMLASLGDGGGIPVKRMDDIEQLSMQDYRSSSYEDEDRINSMAQRVLGALSPASSELLPSSTTATVGLINQQNVATTFDIFRENLGNGIERIIQYQWVPRIIKDISTEEIYRITGSKEDIDLLTTKWAEYKSMNAVLESVRSGNGLPSEEDYKSMIALIKRRLSTYGLDRFLSEVKKEFFDEEYDYEIYTTSEKFDKLALLSNLRQMITEYSQIPGINLNVPEMIKETLDLMGMGGERFFMKQQEGEGFANEPARITRAGQQTPVDRSLNQRQEGQNGRLPQASGLT